MKEGLLQVHLSPHSRVSRVAPRWPPPLLLTHLQFLLGPVGSRCIPQLSRGGGDLPDDASALGRASRHKRSQELTELACIRIKEAVTLSFCSSVNTHICKGLLTEKRTTGVEKLLIHQSNAVLRNRRRKTKQTPSSGHLRRL